MIPQNKCYYLNVLRKPRASGDDPHLMDFLSAHMK